MPIEWYFYDDFCQFFAFTFSSDLVLRLWDMIILNLSTNKIEDRRRALWYLLAVPMYMIYINQEFILKAETPNEVKNLLIYRTQAFNYNPDLFIEDLLVLIQEEFCIKPSGLLETWFGADNTKELEDLRQEVEQRQLDQFIDERSESSKIIKYDIKSHTKLLLNPNIQFQDFPTRFNIQIVIHELRNLFTQREAGHNV